MSCSIDLIHESSSEEKFYNNPDNIFDLLIETVRDPIIRHVSYGLKGSIKSIKIGDDEIYPNDFVKLMRWEIFEITNKCEGIIYNHNLCDEAFTKAELFSNNIHCELHPSVGQVLTAVSGSRAEWRGGEIDFNGRFCIEYIFRDHKPFLYSFKFFEEDKIPSSKNVQFEDGRYIFSGHGKSTKSAR